MKRVAILGSTGNVGKQVLDVVDRNPEKLEVFALAANSNIELIKEQAEKYHPKFVGIVDEEKGKELDGQIEATVFYGKDATSLIAGLPGYDVLVNSLVGLSGIRPTLEAIRNKKVIALANKETLVSAGEIVMREARKNDVKILPIDSEHSAIFQCLEGNDRKDISRIILTCSGGALREKSRKEMETVGIEEALGHKTWNMGKKITIDSATLMNKGFEVIEARWLFDVPVEKIKVVIHPESIIHSMVEYSDASTIAQLSVPDMRLPIQYALSYPERWDAPIERLDFSKNISFQEPDMERFPCLFFAYRAANESGTLPAAMNAANDFMVGKFLSRECSFFDIEKVIGKVMDEHINVSVPELEDIEKAIVSAQEKAGDIFSSMV